LLIESGAVLVAGAPADKPARLVGPDEPVVITRAPPFVGRGGAKLEAALGRFHIDVAGDRAIDVGASTGGFTDCLLQRGAVAVVSLDVGRGQLHERLRGDWRVTSLEQTDVRSVSPEALGGPFDVVVADLSFISLEAVSSHLVELARPGASLIVLVKPQFEVGRKDAAKGKGVIRDPALWRQALLRAFNAFGTAGAAIMGVMVSPLRGADGNVEFLTHLCRPSSPDDLIGSGSDRRWMAMVDDVVTAAALESGVEV
jgi:23S rRNA (cytidine1920-2'-O)/16S rRNA (cytidine1409-2'-O)-methyltransferase